MQRSGGGCGLFGQPTDHAWWRQWAAVRLAGVDRQDVTQQGPPRPFCLVRSSSGITGTVGEGVEWADGLAVVRWCGQAPAVSVWAGGITALLTMHGGDGTEVRWLDTPPRTAAEVGATGDVGLTLPLWLPAPTAEGRCPRCGREWPCLGCGP